MTWVMAHSPRDLTGVEQSVAIVLASFADDDGGSAFPSIATLCQATHWSERTVVRALRELTRRGVIEAEHPATNKRSTVYRFPGFRGVTLTPQEGFRGVRVTPQDDLGVSESPSRGVTVTPDTSVNRHTPPCSPPTEVEGPDGDDERRRRRTRLPAGFALDEKLRAFAEARGWDARRIDRECEKFRAKHTEKQTLSADWRASWRTWVLNGITYDERDRTRTPANQNRGGTGRVVL